MIPMVVQILLNSTVVLACFLSGRESNRERTPALTLGARVTLSGQVSSVPSTLPGPVKRGRDPIGSRAHTTPKPSSGLSLNCLGRGERGPTYQPADHHCRQAGHREECRPWRGAERAAGTSEQGHLSWRGW